MKKIIITLTIIIAALVGTTTFTYASTKNYVQTTLTSVGNINKIEIHGNVEVHVLTGDKDMVEMNNNYYAESALVQGQDGVLRISSYTTQKLIVYVTASDLRAIAAYDNASVVSDKKLSLISLDVDLYNNAYADLDLDNYAANITVNDQAKADIAGNITDYNLVYSSASTVNRAELIAENISEKKIAPKQIVKSAQKVEDDIIIVE